MTDARHQRLRQLFDRALELPAAARAAFFDSNCGDDAELKQRLLAMVVAALRPAVPCEVCGDR